MNYFRINELHFNSQAALIVNKKRKIIYLVLIVIFKHLIA